MATPKKTKPVEKAPVDELAEVQSARVVQLLDDYTGRPSKEKIIKKGIYLDNDKRVMGLADYWLDLGLAKEVDFSDSEKLMLAKEALGKSKPEKARDGLRGHIEPTQDDSQSLGNGDDGQALLPPPETEPLPQNPVRQRPRPVTPAN